MQLPDVPHERGDIYRKPVATLAMVPINGRLTAGGRKLYNVMGRVAQRQGDVGKRGYQAKLKALLRVLDKGSNEAGIMRRYLTEMMSTRCEWRPLKPGEGLPGEHPDDVSLSEVRIFALLAEVRCFQRGRENWVTWFYPPTIEEQILNPRLYAQINLTTMARLGTHAAVALYELCARYQGSGRTPRKPWGWWVPVLRGHEVTGDREYRKFKSELLKPAIAQINEHTEIEIDLVEYREGAAVVDLQFTVKPKPDFKLDQGDIEPVDLTPVEQALALGIRELDYDVLVDRYGEGPVLRALEIAARQLRQEPGTNALAHLKWVLEGVAGESTRKAARRRTSTPSEVATPVPVPSVPVPDPEQELKREQLRRDFEALPPGQQKQWLLRLRDDVVDKGVATPALLRRIADGDWKSPVVLARLEKYFASHQ
ncbi:replication initiation protein [Azohydromonas aeria]|uniref:replication initiation protein n=1 Tax=Azohydromonas aeria TaxID=2590212 RepID=UPI0018DEF0BF|nr:replication initiation protein [Azohydromonas aeria]